MRWVLFLLLICTPCYSFENDWSLKAGLGLNYQTLTGANLSQDNIFGVSGNTTFGYRFTNIAFQVASFISLGHADNIYFKVDNDTHAYAESTYGSFNFLLLFKYYANTDVFKKYQPYISIGPGISLQSFWPDETTILDGFTGGSEKLSLESFGIFGTIGIEERANFKDEFPKFLEIMWGFDKAFKANLVEIENEKTTDIIKSEEDQSLLKNFILIINFGITFF